MGQSRGRFVPEYKDESMKLAVDSGRPISAVTEGLAQIFRILIGCDRGLASHPC